MPQIYGYPDDLQAYITRMSQSGSPPGSSGYRSRVPSSDWDDVIGETGEIADEVFSAFAEQARTHIDSRLAQECLYNCAIFLCRLSLYLVLRIGSDRGLGHF